MDESKALNFGFIANLIGEMPEIPKDGILSRTVFKTAGLNAILFAFDTDQTLSEHTASKAAILHILQGEARLTLGDSEQSAQAHTWVYMPPQLPHSLYAQTPLIMLLIMLGD